MMDTYLVHCQNFQNVRHKRLNLNVLGMTSIDFSQWTDGVQSTDTARPLKKRDDSLLPLAVTLVLSLSMVPEGCGVKFMKGEHII